MLCTSCETKLSSRNYTVVEGIPLCLPCFLNQDRSAHSQSIPRRSFDHVPSSTRATVVGLERTVSEVEQRPRSNAFVGSDGINDRYSARSFSQSNYPKVSRSITVKRTTCQVCYDEKSPQHFSSIPTHACHQHHRTICDQCLYRHLQQTFTNILTDNIRCPELDCQQTLNYETIKHILEINNDEELFERYDQFICRHRLEKMDEFIWCSNPQCSFGQLNDGGETTNIVTCSRCNQKTCFQHKIPWHSGLTCAQYDAQCDERIQASLKWITQNTKQCGKCHFRIEKNDGCDHMTCVKCGYEFCWSCLADFNQIRQDGNHRHDPSCKHYAAYHGQ